MDWDTQDIPAGKKMKPSDFTEYDSLVGKLADSLKIAHHPDPSITIRAARRVIEKALSGGDRVLGSNNTRDGCKIQRSKFELEDIILPNLTTSKHDGTGDDNKQDLELRPDFERAARALKLLYLGDQRDLQSKINNVISSIQSVTANPKTDSRLVAIGR